MPYHQLYAEAYGDKFMPRAVAMTTREAKQEPARLNLHSPFFVLAVLLSITAASVTAVSGQFPWFVFVAAVAALMGLVYPTTNRGQF